MKILIGTSGWQYKQWNKVFYPTEITGQQQLEYFAKSFDTVEVNSSFYRLPRSQSAENWYHATPSYFRFAVKMNNYFTHSKKLITDDNSRKLLKNFSKLIEPLDNKLAAILVQLPPGFSANFKRLDDVARELPKYFKSSPDFAYEFRHASWFKPEMYKILKKYHACLVTATWPGKFRIPQEVTGEVVYIRYHATPEKPDYSKAELREWAAWLKTVKPKRAYIYFNNDFEGWAIINARQLKQYLGE